MPSTSVQISMRRAPNAAPTIAAEKSDPPRPSVLGVPSSVAAMNPPRTGTRFLARGSFSEVAKAGVGGFKQRNGLGMAGVGDDALTGIDMNCVQTGRLEAGRDHTAGEGFAEGEDVVLGSRGEFSERGDAA